MSPTERELYLLPEYGSTPHLPHKANTSRGDTIASEEEAEIIFSSAHVLVEEKVDGSAVAFTCDKAGNIIVRNRNHILHKGFQARTAAKQQYAPLWNYVYARTPQLRALHKTMHGLFAAVYGEWIVMEHGTLYRKELIKKDPFMAYAIYDPEAGKFVDPKLARGLLIDHGFQVPPELAAHVCSYEHLEALTNEFSALSDSDRREGVYVKVGDGRYMTHRFKMVRQGFEPGKHFKRK